MDSDDVLQMDRISYDLRISSLSTEQPDVDTTVEPGPSRSCTVMPETNNEEDDMSSGRSSPDTDSNCSICLGDMVNKSFTDSCMHQFCFTCLKQWSKVKAECPLCKQNFKSIYYNVRSISEYNQYVLPLPPTSPPEMMLYTIYDENDVGRIGVLPPTVQQLWDTPSLWGQIINFGEEDYRRISAPVSRRHYPSTSIGNRLQLYQQGLWTQSINCTSRFRESNPEFYRANPSMVERLGVWLSRELSLLCGGSAPQVTNIILDLVCTVDIRSSVFSNRIAPYLGRHTEHFVHEFYNFAISPHNTRDYDRWATYEHHGYGRSREHTLSTSSDEEVQEVTHPRVAAPLVPFSEASDSDDCVIIDCVPSQSSNSPEVQAARPSSPEVITLDSDDDMVQENTSTDAQPVLRSQRSRPVRALKRRRAGPSSSTQSVITLDSDDDTVQENTSANALPSLQPQPSRPVRTLKRSWTVSPSSAGLRVSININLPESSQVRCCDCRSSSNIGSQSDSCDRNKPTRRTSRKKPNSEIQRAFNRSSHKEEPVVNNRQKTKECENCLVLPFKKRRQPKAIKSSSPEEPSVLHINAAEIITKPQDVSNSPSTSNVRPMTLLESDANCEIKTQPQDFSDLSSASSVLAVEPVLGNVKPEIKTEPKNVTYPSSTSNVQPVTLLESDVNCEIKTQPQDFSDLSSASSVLPVEPVLGNVVKPEIKTEPQNVTNPPSSSNVSPVALLESVVRTEMKTEPKDIYKPPYRLNVWPRPLLESVVKCEIERETQDASDLPSLSILNLPKVKTKKTTQNSKNQNSIVLQISKNKKRILKET